ncbi:MAG: ribosomal protein S18-alanine N-acetyltransferase [Bacillota bacterium]|jgi:ribosomal-protein-alanine N-acetyltransferase
MEKISLLPLKPEDIDQVLSIEKVSFPTPWSRESILNELMYNSLAHYYACFRSDKLIGYGGMWIIIDEAHITTIAVHPDYRGRKIGAAIMLHLMAQAIEKGADKITLEVRPSNIAAERLYSQLGFKAVGRRKGYYSDTKEDAIIMWKNLIVK